MNPINPKTAEKLASPAREGGRHNEALGVAMDLIANGHPKLAVIQTIKHTYGLPDKEIEDLVEGAVNRNPTPSVRGNHLDYTPVKIERKKTPLEQADWWLSGRTMTEEQFVGLSQLPIPGKLSDQTRIVLEMLYDGPDNLNIVSKHFEREEGKAQPHGGGIILTRDEWLDYISKKGVPQLEAGAWLRPNPCSRTGTGNDGAVKDSDVVSHRFLVLESDVLPLEKQMSLFARLKLPISMVLSSGGKSVHAWVKLACSTIAEYSERARRILSALSPFGIDQANKNPSRLSRLPGAVRKIGAIGDGKQKVLWLNPAKGALTDEDLEIFEGSMEIPALEEKPFKKLVRDALERYQEMFENPDKGLIPTGFADFDRDNGGLKASQMTVLCAETGAGKSSVAMNIANATLKSGKSVALFTLEMSNEEITDLMFAMNCKIERDKFNTGRFSQRDLDNMALNVTTLMNLPFWSFDDSLLRVDQIRRRVLQLKREFNIALVIVDYAQIVSPADKMLPREQQVSEIARGLCSLAKDAKIPVVVLSQLNDEGRLRESRVIGHEAHNVIFLENKEQENRIIARVKKGRRIKKRDYVLHYQPEYCLVASEAKINGDDYKFRSNGH